MRAKNDNMRRLLLATIIQNCKAHMPDPAPTSRTVLPLKSEAFIETNAKVSNDVFCSPGEHM
jgi:hypothetical protein